MATKTFKRGLSIPERKHATEGHPNERVPALKQVVIPIHQHFGAPNVSIVNVGDTVKRGQKIADAKDPGPMTVPVHASISGTVKKIEPRALSNNTNGLCIVIEAAPEDGPAEHDFMPPMDPFTVSKEDALARIREAGIIGMGGAGFPTHIKMSPPAGKNIDLLIINAAECEAYLTTDEVVMTEKTSQFIEGITMVMHITGVKQAVIGIEDNKEHLVPMLEKAVAENPRASGILVQPLKSKYPQGGEKMLITAITGREVPSGGLPMDVGCIVQNVGTLVAISEAFNEGKPLIERSLTVTGGACKTPKNIIAPIGAAVSDFPEDFMQVDTASLRKIVFGGPMMGVAVASTAVPIQKNTSGILLLTAKETPTFEESPCIRCARCINNCPCFLSPVLINNALEAQEIDTAQTAGLMDCIECGSCSYVCPARIKLVQRFRVGKQRFRAHQQAAQKAEAQNKK
ncbi:electron transport complex subunit RsxC [Breznakiella homolactica]|uniref:Ion-translocating oxidoreductase complex subunit C n=1 Tax=Breznakiella homolactica TaxID=2798577 RepID=A0A7T7XP01_9SPIR|nr:electron transport complex subunit RsxC [Breznakiella homolactica]QQO09850.1 electron transport complex subunit RsxC [Breznakiella homolactica]